MEVDLLYPGMNAGVASAYCQPRHSCRGYKDQCINLLINTKIHFLNITAGFIPEIVIFVISH